MIDDKLKERILPIVKHINKYTDGRAELYTDKIIKISKQAFAEENWRRIPTEAEMQPYLEDGSAHKLMTGQEWYERFSDELKHLISRGDGETWMGWGCGEVIEAAKRASGIKK